MFWQQPTLFPLPLLDGILFSNRREWVFFEKRKLHIAFLVFSAYVAIQSRLLSRCMREKTKRSSDFRRRRTSGPWRVAETNSIRTKLPSVSETDFLMTDAQGQTSKQFADIEDLIARRVDAIFLAPREYEGLTPALEAARAAKYRCFSLIVEDQASTSSAFGSDFIAQGRRVGEWLAQATDGKASIVELTGTAGSSVAIRSGLFRDAIGSYPHMKIVATQTGGFAGRGSARNGKHHPGQEPTSPRYAHNDESVGAIQALRPQAAGQRCDVFNRRRESRARGDYPRRAWCECRVKPAFWPTCFRHDGEVFWREDSSQDHSQDSSAPR